ncbi:MAG: CRISPR-associated protein Cas4 [Candidatus Thermoplasmatota archaeon]|nr:CRISPR-associated protein Cas4 [Candidatus Thermoplasmatota archaeon]MBS3789607.1 CRISPR-associated protein Cas4 [Candidatus Thermoplasmatota archaeon]
MEEEWISASDIEKFGYCPLSWWLSREKEKDVSNETLKEGEKEHREIGKKLDSLKAREQKLGLLENIILGLAILTTVVSVFGISFLTSEEIFSHIFMVLALIWLLAATLFLFIDEVYKGLIEKTKLERIVLIFAMIATMLSVFSFSMPIQDDLIAQIAQLLSLSWLIGASYWLKHSIKIKSETEEEREDMKLEEGEIKYVDKLEKKSKLLRSEKYKLRGKPDFILEKDGSPVPVEVKTGRVPEGPFFSHILQIAAYCLLVEEDMGKKPPYGLIRYGDTEFDIEYDEDLRQLLLEKLKDMRMHLKDEDVHRNHNREGKCRNCSRRKICEESLV